LRPRYGQQPGTTPGCCRPFISLDTQSSSQKPPRTNAMQHLQSRRAKTTEDIALLR
jgi:hypothetical protein